MGAMLACASLEIFQCAACCACSCITNLLKSTLNATLSQCTRVGHLIILFLVFILAIVLGTNYPQEVNNYYISSYSKLELTVGCNAEYQDDCIYRQLIYRASFSLFCLFFILAFSTTYSDEANKSFWLLKIGGSIAAFIGFWWGSNSFFSVWAEITRVVSFVWLLIQGLMFIDLAYDSHDLIMAEADQEEQITGGDSRTWQFLYLLLSLIGLGCAGTGLAFLFIDYTDCDLGMTITIITVVMGLLTTFFSLYVDKGLLTPCLVFAYSTLMCWYSVLSNPDMICNASADSNNDSKKKTSVIVLCIVSIFVLIYCAVNGTRIMQIFNPEGEGVMISQYTTGESKKLKATLTGNDDESNVGSGIILTEKTGNTMERGEDSGSDEALEECSGSPKERSFYHVLLLIASCFSTMILTSWGNTDGTPEGYGTNSTGTESMWLKISSQWVLLILYCMMLKVSHNDLSA